MTRLAPYTRTGRTFLWANLARGLVCYLTAKGTKRIVSLERTA